MIPLLIIKKLLLFLAPIFLFYFLRKMGKGRQLEGKSKLSDFDKSQIVEGEIIDENSSNR
ncbi:hypothetical protein A3B45_02940 [Candidatus Daviesbacteria bacterium RIFCSPLOWO2_01_FULL_39_12]|uniref:Uncharacterized protein n=1 Tax=Candidatus Daviesbacteria bacterium RIFCSPLOWO2_01_FULL_39_12 TaxID=1797785 RepID=A0A1F5KTP7_9BACT|nr:MAG: hypothetical protein A3B45_02940 [Candidatus Daviesbacteria bacterium RIFCSPLOWO2_01_FULL_39_12]